MVEIPQSALVLIHIYTCEPGPDEEDARALVLLSGAREEKDKNETRSAR